MDNENKAAVMFCASCGKKFEPDDLFCMNCGAKRGGVSTPETVEAAYSAANEVPVNEPLVNEPLVNEPLANETPVNETPVNETPAIEQSEFIASKNIKANNTLKQKSNAPIIITAIVLFFIGMCLGLKPPVPFLEIGTPKADSAGESTVKEDSPKDYEYEIYDDRVEITAYTGNKKKIVIPSEIEGMPVESIGEKAFSECDKLTDIIIPETVTEICADAFSYCLFTEITIPKSVKYIDSYAFADCENLTAVYFEGVAPEFTDIETIFENTPDGFTVYYKKNKGGWKDFDEYPAETY